MSRWSQSSLNKLEELDPRLVGIVERVRDLVDLTILCTFRTPEEQLRAFNEGFSKLKFGKHNIYPALAVDLQPYPVPAKESDLREELSYIAGLMIAFGKEQGLKVRWGGDWDSDHQTRDNSFDDLYHFEIEGP